MKKAAHQTGRDGRKMKKDGIWHFALKIQQLHGIMLLAALQSSWPLFVRLESW